MSDVGTGAASGAAIGTAISPGLGTIIGGGIGALGSAISGIFGASTSSSEASKNRKEARRQFNIQMNESVQRRVQDALAAGINPLAALGYNGGASPTISAGGTSGAGEIIANSGTAASNMIGKSIQSYYDKQADDMYYDSVAKELDLEGKRLQNRLLRQKLSPQAGVDQEPPPSMEGEQTLFKPVYDIKGRPRLVINQDAIESDSDNPAYMSSILNAIGQAISSGQITADGRVVSRQLQLMIDDFYYNTTGHHIKNLSDLYISPTEAAVAATMLARGVS